MAFLMDVLKVSRVVSFLRVSSITDVGIMVADDDEGGSGVGGAAAAAATAVDGGFSIRDDGGVETGGRDCDGGWRGG